jgi:lipopolysaccharide export LptBFGC system permease protein LptF
MILERYMFRELIASFLFAFLAVLVVCLVGTMFQVFRTFPGLGFKILTMALPLATGAMATWVMLVASSTSSTLVYARLAAENEITAMRTCGIHTGRILSPALLLGLLLVCVSYPLNEVVVPWARHNRRILFRLSTLEALKSPPPGNNDFYVGQFRLRYTDYQNGRMINPTITQMKGQTVVMDYYAPSGSILSVDEPMKVVMTKPTYWVLKKNGQQEYFMSKGDVTVEISIKDYESSEPQLVDQPATVLWDKVFATKERSVRNPILLILHTRYASSLAPLILVLVAVPIGILVRRGSRLAGLGAALPPLMIYLISYFVFQGLGDKNRVSPIIAAYAPDAFLSVLAALLLRGVSTK